MKNQKIESYLAKNGIRVIDGKIAKSDINKVIAAMSNTQIRKELNQALKEFGKEHDLSFYVEGGCFEMAKAIMEFLEDRGQKAEYAYVTNHSSYDHQTVKWDGDYWDAYGPHHSGEITDVGHDDLKIEMRFGGPSDILNKQANLL